MSKPNHSALPASAHAAALTDAAILHRWDTHVGQPDAARPLTDADKIAFARAVLADASAPVAGEAQPNRQAVLEAIHRYGNARAMAEHNTTYRDEVRNTYDALIALFDAAPQASEAVRNAALEEAAVAIEDHQREGRGWVPGSFWDSVSSEAGARIRALKADTTRCTHEAKQIADLVLGHDEGLRVSSPLESGTGFGKDVEHRFQVSNGEARYGVIIILTALSAQPAAQKQESRVGTNTGHGHVWRRPDGYLARCGGPAICQVCARDQAQSHPKQHNDGGAT